MKPERRSSLLPHSLALASVLAFSLPAAAQSNEELLKELRALRDRVSELERKLQASQPAAAPPAGQWGMTPEQVRELNRVSVKAESLQDNFADQGLKGLKISGQIDPTWIYNRRQDNASFILLNDGGGRYTYDNSYFGMAVLDFEKETESGARWKLTLAPERGAGAVGNGGSIVHEASVSIPLSDLNTRLWLGQIPDWTGYEMTLPAENKLITHNLLFDTTAPTSFTGAVLDITRGKWWLRAGLANMNSARTGAGEKQPVLTYRLDYARGEFAGWGISGLHGKTANFASEGSWFDAEGVEQGFAGAGRQTDTHLLAADAYFIRGDLSLFGQLSLGQQKGAAIFNSDGRLRDARWWGLSGLVGYKLMPRLEAVLRADYLNNKRNGGGLLGYSFDDEINGIGRGFTADGDYARGPEIGSNRYAIATGLNYLFDESTIFKLELRLDGASQPVFLDLKSGRYVRRNHLLGASVVVSF